MGVKSAKVGLLARYTAKVVDRTGGPSTKMSSLSVAGAKLLKCDTGGPSTKRSSLRGRSKTAKVCGGGGPKLLKCASRRFPAKGLDSPQKGLHFVGGAKLLKLAPPRGGARGGAKLLKFGLPHKSSTPGCKKIRYKKILMTVLGKPAQL